MDSARLSGALAPSSRIWLGSWAFGGDWGSVSAADVGELVGLAREHGINAFDTAYSYGSGRAEELLGEALRDELSREREALVLATKVGLRLEGGRQRRDGSGTALRGGLEQSLRRLGVDHVDLVYLHWPDPEVPVERSVEALGELVAEGKARAAGVSNLDAGQLDAVAGLGMPLVAQNAMHLLHRQALGGALAACRAWGIGFLGYSALAHGLLAGSVTETREFDARDWRASSPVLAPAEIADRRPVVDALRALAAETGLELPELALGWVLAQEGVGGAVVGARNPRQLEVNCRAAALPLPAELQRRCEAIVASVPELGVSTPETRATRG